MTDNEPRFRILHLLSASHMDAGQPANMALAVQLLSLVSRIDQSHFELRVINFAPSDKTAVLLRQTGLPVYDIELSRHRWSVGALSELRKQIGNFKPDLIHAWGHTAQLATRLANRRVGAPGATPIIWTMPGRSAATSAKPAEAHWLDRLKLRSLLKQAARPEHVIYPSVSSAAQHKRLGFPEQNAIIINPGVDAERFKPDARAGQQLREQLKLDASAFVIGMHAPFLPESDYATFVRATAELIKYHPNIFVLAAGRGVQRGNSGVMALLGGGTLANRTSLLGEWSDMNGFFNACDVVCCSALDDSGASMLASAMLSGVPCVGTGKGLQGEVLLKHGITIEPGSPNSLARGITRLMELSAEKRAHLIDSARQHIVNHHSVQSAVQKYLGLYLQMMHKQETATAERAIKLQRAAVR